MREWRCSITGFIKVRAETADDARIIASESKTSSWEWDTVEVEDQYD